MAARVPLASIPRLRIGAAVALALAAGLVTWLLVRHTGHSSAPQARSGAVAATVAELRGLPAALGHPVYWAGARTGRRFELTRTADGRVYIRYLPATAKVGDPRPNFLAVGTYPQAHPFAQVQAAARRPGASTLTLPAGGLAVYDRKRPTSIYLAYPGSTVQVEVYDPDPAQARQLVRSGRITEIG